MLNTEMKNLYYTYKVIVDSNSIDENNHVNNVKYLEWMQDAAMKHTVDSGVYEKTIDSIHKWFTKKNIIEYEGQSFLGDKLEIITWLSEIKNTSAVRKYIIYNARKIIATGESIFIYFSLKEMKPIPIPNIVEKLVGVSKEAPNK